MAHTSTNAQEVDAFASAVTLLHALRERRISAVELLDLHLDRIARYNPTLNAIVTPAYDQARQDAARADAARARGEDGLLLGLPLTVKETIDIKGLPTTGGVPEHAHDLAETDAPIVARCERPARSLWVRRMCRRVQRTGSPPIHSSGAQTIPGTSRAHQVVVLVGEPQLWPLASLRWNWGVTLPGPSASPPLSAASTGTSRVKRLSHVAAPSLEDSFPTPPRHSACRDPWPAVLRI